MHYLVDGYNLLFSLQDSEDLRKNREQFLQTLEDHVRVFRSLVTIVFDGKSAYGEESGYAYFSSFLVVFSPHNQTADEYIVEKILFSSSPANFTVITQDKALIQSVRKAKAHTKPVQWFLRWVEKHADQAEEKPLGDTPFHKSRLQKIFEKKWREKE
ncbi:MAG: NYN domain-containing protein [Chlamydiota bacterium]